MSGNGKNGNYTAAQFIQAIPGSGGIITTIAARIPCAWHTAKKYIDVFATVKQAYDDECNKVLDLAESNILRDLNAHDVQTSKWYLGMKGSVRDYVPKQTRTVENTGEIVLRVVYDDDGIDDQAQEHAEASKAAGLHTQQGEAEGDPGGSPGREDDRYRDSGAEGIS